MVNIKARTHILLSKVEAITWVKIVPVTHRDIKNTKRGKKCPQLWAITVINFIQQKHVFNKACICRNCVHNSKCQTFLYF